MALTTVELIPIPASQKQTGTSQISSPTVSRLSDLLLVSKTLLGACIWVVCLEMLFLLAMTLMPFTMNHHS